MASLHDGSLFCIPELELPTNTSSHANYRDIYSYVSLASASVGLVASLIQFIAWIISTRRLEAGEHQHAFVNPIIIICLAFANFLTCIGVILRSVALILYGPPLIPLNQFINKSLDDVSYMPSVNETSMIPWIVIESFTDYFYVAVLLWTLAYCVDVLRKHKDIVSESPFVRRPSSTYLVICWGLPIAFVGALSLYLYLDTEFPKKCPDQLRTQLCDLILYLPAVVELLVIPFLLIRSRTLVRNSIQRRTGTYSARQRRLIRVITGRFVAIVLFLYLCWVPNIIDSIIRVLMVHEYITTTTDERYKLLFPIWIIEAVMNPIQGFFNCFIYGVPGFPTSRCSTDDEDALTNSLEESQSLLSSSSSGLQRKCNIR
ncbi:hypothetical protein SNE40_012261 [Patella caerulea]|uniref:G-protein coupled receptors family 1 profile domain-containing protein n=1 Tax=Patella caerulea TaxID=87958 RepID=A0AAN8PVM5_PATCE